MENLEGNRPPMAEVPGEVDGCHAPAPEFALDLVPLAERLVNGRFDERHRVPPGERNCCNVEEGNGARQQRGSAGPMVVCPGPLGWAPGILGPPLTPHRRAGRLESHPHY